MLDFSEEATLTGPNILAMSFLKRLWTIFAAFFRIGTDPRPGWGNLINRFLTHKNHFAGNRIRRNAFLPPPDLKLSVFFTGGLSDVEIWRLGEIHVSKKLYGRAELTTADVKEVGLEIDPDNTPERHATVSGWPTQKSAQILYALKLAEKATLVLRSQQGPS